MIENETPPPRSSRWLSTGFEELVGLLRDRPAAERGKTDFDVVIVGSGYGGAVAAAELARHANGQTICVLERGCEHLPGSFPGRMADLAGHVRFATPTSKRPRGVADGLFDVRLGNDLTVLMANGVGGGSLINAGVMEMAPREVFKRGWPTALQSEAGLKELEDLALTLRARLGASRTLADVNFPPPAPFEAMRALQQGQSKFVPLHLSVALADEGVSTVQTPAGIRIDACRRCGDCATGCNENAKTSLDATLLAEARRAGALIYAGATVVHLCRPPDDPTVWELAVEYTDEHLRERMESPLRVRARRVVLAAGALGSTEILMRSRSETLSFSPQLGRRFSSNGDFLAAGYHTSQRIDGFGNEEQDLRPSDGPGPTIVGMVDLRETVDPPMVVQNLTVPGPLKRLLDQTLAVSSTLRRLAEPDVADHAAQTLDPCAIDETAVGGTLLVAAMGPDSADGVLAFGHGHRVSAGEGSLCVQWPTLRDSPLFARMEATLRDQFKASVLGGQLLVNPMWRPLPADLDFLFASEKGPLLTVHPLGGCSMADDAERGVVDDCGRVFDPKSGTTHNGLVVLDGAIIPGPLSINPALTISAVALRAIERLRVGWGFDATSPQRCDTTGNLDVRPRQAVVERRRAERTRVEILERLSGTLPGFFPQWPQAWIELTMRFDPASIDDLTRPAGRTLHLSPGGGDLRVYKTRPADDSAKPILTAQLHGTLKLLHFEASSALQRRLRALPAWLLNRGIRDTVLWLIDRWCAPQLPPDSGTGLIAQGWSRWSQAWNLCSLAGAVRLFDYDLDLRNVECTEAKLGEQFEGRKVLGHKRLTYACRSNPWRQLSEMTLESIAGRPADGALLKLDLSYLSRQGFPLVRIVGQENQPAALADLAALGLYLMRVIVQVHAWSFRAPDAPSPRDIHRLPGATPGLPPPQIEEVLVDRIGHEDVAIRLTRYPTDAERTNRPTETKPPGEPVLLIHGYSASGTTFAHPAVRPNLAEALHKAGRDVWIVDLRTSAGMPLARRGWSFEEVANADVVVAIRTVLQRTGKEQLDIVAHCMGSAMLAMALLDGPTDLSGCVRKLVTSQVTPAPILTPANVFRGFVMQWLKQYLPLSQYSFRPDAKPTLVDQLIDRLFATMPYPEEEFTLENPVWPLWRRTPWTATRHRMDALYGRDFSLKNVSRAFLDHIDDHFGPLSVETVSQGIHFATFRTITDRRGVNLYTIPSKLREHYAFPILHVHGEENGLMDFATGDHTRRLLQSCNVTKDGGVRFEIYPYKGGHQDGLVGTPSKQVFCRIVEFLEEAVGANTTAPLPASAPAPTSAGAPAPAPLAVTCTIPVYGVRWEVQNGAATAQASFGTDGSRGTPMVALLIPVDERDGRFQPVDSDGNVADTVEALKKLIVVRTIVSVAMGDNETRFTFMAPAAVGPHLTLVLFNQVKDIGPVPPQIAELNLLDFAKILAERIQPDAMRPQDFPIDPGGIVEVIEILIDMIVKIIATAAKDGIDATSTAMLSLGVLRKPRATSPEHPRTVFEFALASCQYPGGMLDRTPPGVPLNGIPGPADASMCRLAATLDDRPDLSLLILAGDQIYVDATAGLFDPRLQDDRFRLPYQTMLGARGMRSIMARLPVIMCLDDHEIGDNWEPLPSGRSDPVRRLGIDAFLKYQRDQDPEKPTTLHAPDTIGGFRFYFGDARTERTFRNARTLQSASLLGRDQLSDFMTWFKLPGQGPRFVVTASMILPRRLSTAQGGQMAALRSDAWDGYPATLYPLLAALCERSVNDLIFLSGDEHVSNVATITVKRKDGCKTAAFYSVHSSGLYSPYPFANSRPSDFEDIPFEFDHEGHTYACDVRTRFVPGDGFGTVRIDTETHGWRGRVDFFRGKDTIVSVPICVSDDAARTSSTLLEATRDATS